MKIKMFFALPLLLLTSATAATDKADFLGFFESYQSLQKNYDTSITKLYSDSADITGIRLMPDGTRKEVNLAGSQWKEVIINVMPVAQKRGDISEFSQVEIEVTGQQARVSANRYATIKCFEDTDYFMIIEKNDHELKIIKEYMTSPVVSGCEVDENPQLSRSLSYAAQELNKVLPVMADQDSKLVKASSEGTTFIYHYVLVDYLAEEILIDDMKEALTPLLVEQTCTIPSIRPIVEQGGKVRYEYSSKNNVYLLGITVDGSFCA
ncbi:hypothetical protein [Shewanella youngdeokensis]|uniref:Nuclear transport factor 2 family protein n=1 Tax=Shewanella youngdeokensis TaxID=2999068 RepID=A0ABZ0JZM2_9GAMM|nr:hypothetical protein RGE70_02755 [Shewanella sp. DAU334]